MVHWNCQAMTWTAAEVWCSSWLASYSSWEGTQAYPEQEHVLLSGGFFPIRKRPRHFFRGNIVPVKHPPCSKRSPQLVLHLVYQSAPLSQTLSLSMTKRFAFTFLTWRTKNPVKPSTYFFFTFCKAHTPVCLAEIVNSSRRFLIAPVLQYIAGYNLILEQKKRSYL